MFLSSRRARLVGRRRGKIPPDAVGVNDAVFVVGQWVNEITRESSGDDHEFDVKLLVWNSTLSVSAGC